MIIFTTQKKLTALIDERIAHRDSFGTSPASAVLFAAPKESQHAKQIADIHRAHARHISALRKSYARAEPKGGHTKTRKQKPNGHTIMEALEMVLNDGEKRSVERAHKDASRIYGKCTVQAVHSALCKMTKYGDVARVGSGIYRKAS